MAVATGVHPLYGISCAIVAGLLASASGDSKVRVTAPSVIFVAIASSIVAHEGILALPSFPLRECALGAQTPIAGILQAVFLVVPTLLRKIPMNMPRAIAVGRSVTMIKSEVTTQAAASAEPSSTRLSPANLSC
jgi:MFS superfamily sulfate permease-like transporter